MYPTLSEYNTEIAKYGKNVFSTHNDIEFIPSRTTPIKIFSHGTGSYAVVFKVHDSINTFAIRCFISPNPEAIWRYKEINSYLKNINESWITKFDFIEDEIVINKKKYPIVKMEWVEGRLLNQYIDTILFDNDALNNLQKAIISLSNNLESNQVGHGDIQCGNIIIQGLSENPIIRLVDYDGMYIPAFKNKINLERGRSEFQHPLREYLKFDEKIDRFAFWVIICTLEALKYNKELWKEIPQGGFNNGDNLLFLGSDFKNFNTSQLVNKLYNFNIESLNFYLDYLKTFCLSSSLSIAKPILYKKNPTSIDLKKSINDSIGLSIVSIPSGASVFNENHIKIGQTPIVLKKDEFINQTIILAYGTRFKTFQISNSTTDIVCDFKALTPLTPESSIPLKGRIPSFQVVNNDIETPPPPIISPLPTPKAKNQNKIFILFLILFCVFFIAIIASIIYSKFKSSTELQGYNSQITIDSTAVRVDTAAINIDTTYAIVDTTAVIVDNNDESTNALKRKIDNEKVLDEYATTAITNISVITFNVENNIFKSNQNDLVSSKNFESFSINGIKIRFFYHLIKNVNYMFIYDSNNRELAMGAIDTDELFFNNASFYNKTHFAVWNFKNSLTNEEGKAFVGITIEKPSQKGKNAFRIYMTSESTLTYLALSGNDYDITK